MKDWKKTLISPLQSIVEAMRIIDQSALQIALVVDEQMKLLGVVTDGDIRRGILKGVQLDQPVTQIMAGKFISTQETSSKEEIIALMKGKSLNQLPVLNRDGHVVDLKVLVDLINGPKTNNEVVLMAGGLGNRLKPLTNDCPKPMLTVQDKPILEIILENLIQQGFKKFYMSVNYKAEMIEKYFGDGANWDVKISYLKEKKTMGTAGSLGLLPERPQEPLIVMNADLLTKINFRQLLDFHNTHKALATMCVRNYCFQVPFGVVNIDQHRLCGIDEKPTHHFFVNAGIYVLSPDSLDFIPKEKTYDMPELFQEIVKSDLEVIAFPVREYWLDIGRLDDYQKANTEYHELFNKQQ